jgi:hypothetical protein
MNASAKHQVLKKMRKAGPVFVFIPGTHLVQQTHGSQRGGMIFIDNHNQTIRQDKPFKFHH